MNLVFPALVIFLVLYPGIVFRRTYRSALWGDYPLGRLGPVSEQIPAAFGHAVWLNIAWFVFVKLLNWTKPEWFPAVDLEAVIQWFSNNFGKDQSSLATATTAITHHPWNVLSYFPGLFAFSFGLAWLFRTSVRRLHLDWRYKWLRFDNYWFYLLNGELLYFKGGRYPGNKVEKEYERENRRGTIITAIVDMKEHLYLYTGVLVEPLYDSNGNLNFMVLEGVQRRELRNDKSPENEEEERFYDIDGHYFVLRTSEVKTINVDYVLKSDLDEANELSRGDGKETDGIGEVESVEDFDSGRTQGDGGTERPRSGVNAGNHLLADSTEKGMDG